MPIPRYGVWKGTPTAWDPTQKPDHGHLTFTDSSGRSLDAAINVLSDTPDTRLVYWIVRNFGAKHHTKTASLSQLKSGFNALPHSSSEARPLALDFFRAHILSVCDGVILAHDEVLDLIDPILGQAVTAKADLYIFGQEYDTLDGIHDVHMNQGDADSVNPTTGKPEDFSKDNGTFQDGGIILRFPDGHWEAVFLAFASQASKTDDKGMPDGPLFSDVLPVGPNSSEPAAGSTSSGNQAPPDAVNIHAALLNPPSVYLLNKSPCSVSLDGWTLSTTAPNQDSQTTQIPAGTTLKPLGRLKLSVSSDGLSADGGAFILKNASGTNVSQLSYTAEDAKMQGNLLYFGRGER